MWITSGDKGCPQELHLDDFWGLLWPFVTICGSLLVTKGALKRSMWMTFGDTFGLCGHMWITFGDKGCPQEVHVEDFWGTFGPM